MDIQEIARFYNLPDNKITEYTSSNFKQADWHRGFILVTEELANSEAGEKALNALKLVFIERLRTPKENGILKIEGWSYLFDKCNEGEAKQYDVVFEMNTTTDASGIDKNPPVYSFKEFILVK